MPTPSQFTKDPDAVLDWVFDWREDGWLPEEDSISSADVLVNPTNGINVDSVVHDDDKVTFFLSGGVANTTSEVTCRINTSEGRTDDRTIRINIRER